MRRALLFALVLVGLAFPAGLGLAVYVASGSSLVPPAVTARVPTVEIARPSSPPATTSTVEDGTTTEDGASTEDETTTDDTTTGASTTLELTTTDEDSGSGRGRGRGRGRSGDD